VNSKAALGLSAGALVVGLLGGLALGGESGDKTTNASGPGPTKVVAGVPVGYERSKAGAVAAAASYTRALGQSLGKGRSQREAVVDAASVEERKVTLIGAETDAEKALEANKGFVRLGILGQRVSSFTSDVAKVSLWTVSVVTQAGSQGQAAWGTGEVELHWLDGDWKLWSTSVNEAAAVIPALVGAASSSKEFLKSASEYSEIDDVDP
jgi:hypothetical protein